jgi:hypothetical protein
VPNLLDELTMFFRNVCWGAMNFGHRGEGCEGRDETFSNMMRQINWPDVANNQ